jgi:hypothetical protein
MGGLEAVKTAETIFLEMRVLDDGFIQARRKDRKPLTEADKREVEQWADSSPGIAVDDVLRVFPGARIISQKG